jgi:hypothetical protein
MQPMQNHPGLNGQQCRPDACCCIACRGTGACSQSGATAVGERMAGQRPTLTTLAARGAVRSTRITIAEMNAQHAT